jgi:DNA invertase Pin-like site-specific DNA recombinase
MILGYVRCSTAEQTDGSTLEDQEQVIHGLAMMRGAKGFDVSIFSDPGVSGATPLADRPAGKDLLAAAKKGDIICAAKLDRLFRSAADALATVDSLKSQGIDLILADMGTTPVTENGYSRLFFGMLSCFAEFERRLIAERMATGKNTKREAGGFVGGFAPYGYRKVGHGRESYLVPNPKEQEVIALVRSMHDGQATTWQISQKLNSCGYRNRRDGEFQGVQITRMLERKPQPVVPQ